MTLDSAAISEKIQTTVHQEYKIMAEYKMLQSESIPGVYLVPSAESSFIWFGVIFVRRGAYKDGIFRFNLSIPPEFPNTTQTPVIIFQSQTFHPSICPFTGTLDISDAFPKWNTENHIWQVLKYVIFLFENPNQGKVSNQDAMAACNENLEEFTQKVNETVELSKEKLYEEPPTTDRHYITFETWTPEVHEPALNEIKNTAEGAL